MWRQGAAWLKIRALCAGLVTVLSLAVAPAFEAVKHGPGALAAEAEHSAFHAGHGHVHAAQGGEHHDSGDHDHIGAALLVNPWTEFHPAPERKWQSDHAAATEKIRDGPRRPPRVPA